MQDRASFTAGALLSSWRENGVSTLLFFRLWNRSCFAALTFWTSLKPGTSTACARAFLTLSLAGRAWSLQHPQIALRSRLATSHRCASLLFSLSVPRDHAQDDTPRWYRNDSSRDPVLHSERICGPSVPSSRNGSSLQSPRSKIQSKLTGECLLRDPSEMLGPQGNGWHILSPRFGIIVATAKRSTFSSPTERVPN